MGHPTLEEHLSLYINEVVLDVSALKNTGGVFRAISARRGRGRAAMEIETAFWVGPSWELETENGPFFILRASYPVLADGIAALEKANLSRPWSKRRLRHPEVFDFERAFAALETLSRDRAYAPPHAPHIEAVRAPYQGLWEFGRSSEDIEADLSKRWHIGHELSCRTEEPSVFLAWVEETAAGSGPAAAEAAARAALELGDLSGAERWAHAATHMEAGWARGWAVSAAVAAALGDRSTTNACVERAEACRGATDVRWELAALRG